LSSAGVATLSATLGISVFFPRPWLPPLCFPRHQIAVKAARGKLKFSAADTRHALEDLDIRLLPYTANQAFFLFDLPPLHADRFDRQIIAQALCEEIPVMTCDEKFSLQNGLKVLS
jgi:PIN domain nuclease of toxin-antitoxin system